MLISHATCTTSRGYVQVVGCSRFTRKAWIVRSCFLACIFHCARGKQDFGFKDSIIDNHASDHGNDNFLHWCPAPRRYDSTCTLFMANSSIPGAGVGIFTTETLLPGDLVGMGEVMNPLINFLWHHPVEQRNPGGHPFQDYVWQGSDILSLETSMGGYGEDTYYTDGNIGFPIRGEDGVQMLGYGLDAAINCHLGVTNIGSSEFGYDEYNTGRFDRFRDPGAGAFSPFLVGQSIVANVIPRGGELMKHYGDAWFLDAERTERFGLLPLTGDYKTADLLIQQFGLLFPEIHDKNDLTPYHKDLWDLMANFPFESRILNAIPKQHDMIPLSIRESIWEPYVEGSRRPIEELEQTGRCLENISNGPSTLPQAGRGAFATRDLAKGSIITGSPVMHVESSKIFEMYKDKRQEWNGQNHGDTSVVGYQLMLNYCYGRPQSSILLCPYGVGVNYINHNQTLANVKIQWGRHGEVGHDNRFLEKKWEDIFCPSCTKSPQLAFDFVALRDIKLGEELFLDYGIEFEKAWQRHVESYSTSVSKMMSTMHNNATNSTKHESAQRWNREHANEDIRTDQEQEAFPYPPNLEIRCHAELIAPQPLAAAVAPLYLRDYSWKRNDKGASCHVVGKKHSSSVGRKDVVLYDVIISDHHQQICVLVGGIPRNAMRFFDRAYTKDFHLPTAFRHYIGIPDDMLFPDAWKNKLHNLLGVIELVAKARFVKPFL